MQDGIFVGGVNRSGTTLLTDLMGMHPEFSPIYDTDYIVEMAEILFGCPEMSGEETIDRIMGMVDAWSLNLPVLPSNRAEHERYYHGPNYVLFDRDHVMRGTLDLLRNIVSRHPLTCFREYMDTLFAAHLEWDRKPRWINKVTAYVRCPNFLHTLYPDMRFLHCVRDGRDVARSLEKLSLGQINLPTSTQVWADGVMDAVRFELANPGQTLVVRYEDLVRFPVETLNRAFRWLEVEPCGQQVMETWTRAGHRIDTTRVGLWVTEMDSASNHTYWAANGNLLRSMGYYPEPVGTLQSQPLTVPIHGPVHEMLQGLTP